MFTWFECLFPVMHDFIQEEGLYNERPQTIWSIFSALLA